jgi:hypothetical protein
MIANAANTNMAIGDQCNSSANKVIGNNTKSTLIGLARTKEDIFFTDIVRF